MWPVGCSAAIPMTRRAEIASTQAAGATWTSRRCRKETALPTHGPGAGQASSPSGLGARHPEEVAAAAGAGGRAGNANYAETASTCSSPAPGPRAGKGSSFPWDRTDGGAPALCLPPHREQAQQGGSMGGLGCNCLHSKGKHKLSSTPSAAVAGMGLPYEDGAGLGRPGPHPGSAEITAPGDAFTSCSGSCLSLQSSRQNRQLINSTLTAPSCPAWPQQQEETPMGPAPLSQLYPPWELYLHSSVDLSPRACPPHAIHHVGTLGLRGGGGGKEGRRWQAGRQLHSLSSPTQ